MVDNGRSAIYIHGGCRPLTDINALITTVNDLTNNNDPISNIFIGDMPTINSQADEREQQGNYRYPELRNAGFAHQMLRKASKRQAAGAGSRTEMIVSVIFVK